MPKAACALHNALRGEFGNRIAIDAGPVERKGMTGAFEVTVGGRLIHSKLKMGHGKVQTEEELDKIVGYIQTELERRRPRGEATTKT